MADKCLDVQVIPQYGGTCWLNAIMMSALYSQGSKYFVKKASRNWNKNNSLLRFFKKVIFNIDKNPKVIQKLFKKIKPEVIMFKLIEQTNNKRMLRNLKFEKNPNLINFAYYLDYVTTFYKFMGLKMLDIYTITHNNKEVNLCNISDYLRLKKVKDMNYSRTVFDIDKYHKNTRIQEETRKKIEDIPDIIVLFNEKVYPNIKQLYHAYDINKSKISKSVLERYVNKSDIIGIETYDEIISINSVQYKLDSVLIINYNHDNIDRGHAITGITCNNNKYVYNGWTKLTTDPAKINKDLNGGINPCSLMKYNWDLKIDEEFCLNPNTCKLNFNIDKKDLCFSFNKGNRVLIYTRIIKDSHSTSTSKSTSLISSNNIKELSNIDSIIFKMYNIDRLELEDLKTLYLELSNKLNYFNDENVNKPIEELREIVKPLLLEYFHNNKNKKNNINIYIKNINKLSHLQLLELFQILTIKYKLKLNNYILRLHTEVIRNYLKNQIKDLDFKSSSISSSSSKSKKEVKKEKSKEKSKEDTKSIILNGKKYKLDKSKCNEWISNNKEKNPFTNRKIAANSPISKTLEKECLNFDIKKEVKKEKSESKDTKSIILNGKKYKLDKSKCNEWIYNNKEKNPFTNRKIAPNSPISKTLEKECINFNIKKEVKKEKSESKDKSKDTKSIILSGKKYKLDKSKCNEWIYNNKEKNPFTNRKIAPNSPISKTLEKECLNYI
jgi:hypothetical protein